MELLVWGLIVISRISDTYAIRNGAMRFAGGAQDFAQKVGRLQAYLSNLLAGGKAWTGQGATSFAFQGDKMVEDVKQAGTIFEKIAGVLQNLAGQLDQVNALIHQSEQLQYEIDSLHYAINSTDDPHARASLRSELSYVLNRRAALIAESEWIEQRANQAASQEFDQLDGLLHNLHCLKADQVFRADPSVLYSGTARQIALGGNAKDLYDGVSRYSKGFGVERVDTSSGRMAKVSRGAVENIKGTKYYYSNGNYYSQVLKYVDGKSAAKVSLKEIKGAGPVLGYASVAWTAGDNLVTNIQEGKSASHITAEATVDIGVGVGSIVASAWAGAEAGAFFGTFAGGPVGTLAGAATGFVVGLIYTFITDGIIIDGKSINDHMKEGLESAIDGLSNLAISGWDAVSDMFD